MTFGILALGFPVSEDLVGFAAFGGSQSHFLPYLPILMHSLGDVWHPGSGVPFLPYLPYLNAFLR